MPRPTCGWLLWIALCCSLPCGFLAGCSNESSDLDGTNPPGDSEVEAPEENWGDSGDEDRDDRDDREEEADRAREEREAEEDRALEERAEELQNRAEDLRDQAEDLRSQAEERLESGDRQGARSLILQATRLEADAQRLERAADSL